VDAVHANEIDAAAISERLSRIDVELCSLELRPVLPPEVYTPLEEREFGTLRDALRTLYEEWL
jgi:hypothetical protein